MRAFAIFCVFALIALPQPALSKSLKDDYTEVWTARHERYVQLKEDSIKAQDTAFAALFESAKAHNPDLLDKLKDLIQKSQDIGYYAARADQLIGALHLVNSNASVDRAQLWIQDQVERAQQFSQNASAALSQAKAMSDAIPLPERLKSFGQAAFKQGVASGSLQELQLVQQNLEMYYQSKAEHDARRRARWAAALGAISQSLRDNETQNQALLNSLPSTRQTRCQTTGQMTNCTTF